MSNLEQKVADLAVDGEEKVEPKELVQEEKPIATRTGVIYDERMLHHRNDVSPNHPEVPERISRAWEGLVSRGITTRCAIVEAREATKDEIKLVHDDNHYQLVASTADMTPEKQYHLSLCFSSIYFNSFTFTAAKVAAGCVTEITEQVALGKLRNGIAIVRPPGHHAECEFSMGFCHFNNVAIATQYAIDKLGLERILIVDWDVHHGNGTQHSFYSDKRVLYVSLHRYDNGQFYPGTPDADYNFTGGPGAEGYNINVAWNWDTMGDAEYLAAFHYIIMPIAYEYNPELVIVSCGFDAAEGDPLGRYRITPAGYAHMTHLLSSLANGKLVVAMEGGYNLTAIEYSTAAITSVLLGDQPLPPLEPLSPCESAIRSILQTGHAHSKYWDSLKIFADVQSAEEEEPDADELIAAALSEARGQEGTYPNPHRPGPIDPQVHEERSSRASKGIFGIGGPLLHVAGVVQSPLELLSTSSVHLFGRSGPWLDIANVVPRPTTPPNAIATNDIMRQHCESPVKIIPEGGASGATGAEGGGEGETGIKLNTGHLTASQQAVVNTLEQAGVTAMFAVTPKPWCQHLEDHVKPLPPGGIDANKVCETCHTPQEPWICLTCYHVFCGRYVNQHMLTHTDTSGHVMVLSLADISVWCFACDSYIDNHILHPAINSAHHSKFGVYIDGTS